MATRHSEEHFQLGGTHDPIPQILPKAMMAAARMQGRMTGTMIENGIEVLDFMKERFGEDRKLVQRVAAADDAGAVMDAWMEFWRLAVTDYTDEMYKLMRAGGKMAGGPVEELARSLKETEAGQERRTEH